MRRQRKKTISRDEVHRVAASLRRTAKTLEDMGREMFRRNLESIDVDGAAGHADAMAKLRDMAGKIRLALSRAPEPVT